MKQFVGFYTLIIFIVLLFSFSTYSQVITKYSQAMDAFTSKEYDKARLLFSEIIASDEYAGELSSTASFYHAESLANLGLQSAAEAAYLTFVKNYRYSSYREIAFDRLEDYYYNSRLFDKCKSLILKRVSEYPFSSRLADLYYRVAEIDYLSGGYDEAIKYYTNCSEVLIKNDHQIDVIYSLANCYEMLGNYKTAITYYDKLLSFHKSYKNAPIAQFQIGKCFFKIGEYERASLELRDPIIKTLSEEVKTEANFLLANSFLNINDNESVLGLLKESTFSTNDPHFGRSIAFLIADAKFRLKKYDEAFKEFSTLSIVPDSIGAASAFRKGEIKRLTGKEKEAIKIFDDIIKNYTTELYVQGAKYQLGAIYLAKNDFDSADKYLSVSAATGDFQLRAKSYLLLGDISLKQKKYSVAERNYKFAANITPLPQEYINRAQLGQALSLFYRAKYDEALIKLMSLDSLAQNFEIAKVKFHIAESQSALGNYKIALPYYSKAEEQNSELQSSIVYSKGYALFNTGDFISAKFVFDDFVKKYPEDLRVNDARLRYADCLLGEGDFQQATVKFKELSEVKALSNHKDYISLKYSEALHKTGKSETAILELQKFYDNFSYSSYAPVAKYFLAWLYSETGKYTKSNEVLKPLKSSNSNLKLLPLVYYTEGMNYFHLEEYKQSITSLKKILQDYPQTENILDVITGLQNAYIENNEHEKAVKVLDDFLAKNGKSDFADRLLYQKSSIQYDAKEFTECIKTNTRIIKNYPSSSYLAEVTFLSGLCSEEISKYNDAVRWFYTTLDLYTESEYGIKSAYKIISIFNDKLKLKDSTDKYLDVALRKFKDGDEFPPLMYQKGMILLQRDEVENAYDVFSDVAKYFNGTKSGDLALLEKGKIEIIFKRWDKATEILTLLSGRRTDSIGAEAAYRLGMLLIERAKLKEGITQLLSIKKSFADQDKWVVKAMFSAAESYVKLKEIGKARDILKEITINYKETQYATEAKEKLKKL